MRVDIPANAILPALQYDCIGFGV